MTSGLWGKLPSRGDFVRLGLGRGFTDPWDDWMSAMLAASQAALGDAWRDAWTAAPVWRFCLGAGLCGAEPVLGVWMPSVDSAGRCYPLTLAAAPAGPGSGAEAWLDAAEAAGRAALAEILEPAAVAARMPDPAGLDGCRSSGSAWWQDSRARPLPGMPDVSFFIEMLA